MEALNEAIHRFGPSEIMNTDQASQFTSFALDRPSEAGRHADLDGRQGPVSRHRFDRASMTFAEARVRLASRPEDRIEDQGRRWPLDRLLQATAAPCRLWRTTVRRGLPESDQIRMERTGSSLDDPGSCSMI